MYVRSTARTGFWSMYACINAHIQETVLLLENHKRDVRTDITQTEREVTYRNELSEDEVLWRYFADTVIIVSMHESREFPDSMRTY